MIPGLNLPSPVGVLQKLLGGKDDKKDDNKDQSVGNKLLSAFVPGGNGL